MPAHDNGYHFKGAKDSRKCIGQTSLLTWAAFPGTSL
jgi:hypothetical protein